MKLVFEDFDELVNILQNIEKNLEKIASELKSSNMWNRVPYNFKVKFLYETKGGDHMANEMVYGVTAGVAGAADVVERRMTVEVDGTVVETKTFAGDVVDLGELKVAQNANIVLTLVDVDDVGNVSQPTSCVFVATDTVAPPAPGNFGVAVLREE